MKTLLKMLMFHAMGTQIIIFTSMLFLIHIGTVDGDSCVNYQDPSTCGAHSICIWDSDLSRCVCNSVVPQDVVIIMDSSGSVLAEGWIIQKAFVYDLISTAIPRTSSVGLVQFATATFVRYELGWDQNRTELLSVVDNLEYTRGWTYMKDAVQSAVDQFRNQSMNTQRRMVLITDGNLYGMTMCMQPMGDWMPLFVVPSSLSSA